MFIKKKSLQLLENMIKRVTKNLKQKQQVVYIKIQLLKQPQIICQWKIKKIFNNNIDNKENLTETRIVNIGILKCDRKYVSSME